MCKRVRQLNAWEAIGELESVDVHQLKNRFRKDEIDGRVGENIAIEFELLEQLWVHQLTQAEVSKLIMG